MNPSLLKLFGMNPSLLKFIIVARVLRVVAARDWSNFFFFKKKKKKNYEPKRGSLMWVL